MKTLQEAIICFVNSHVICFFVTIYPTHGWGFFFLNILWNKFHSSARFDVSWASFAFCIEIAVVAIRPRCKEETLRL